MTDATKKCQHCGSIILHEGICPRIRAVEYHSDGSIKRVEYVEPKPLEVGSPFTGVGTVTINNPPTTWISQ